MNKVTNVLMNYQFNFYLRTLQLNYICLMHTDITAMGPIIIFLCIISML